MSKFWNQFNMKHALRDYFNDIGMPGMSFGKIMAQVLGSFIKSVTDSGMTQGQIERADRQLEDTRILNEEEYDRKIDFYERFESPSALVGQYKAAGLNPALLYGNMSTSASGGIGSAGSVSQASAASGGMSAMLGMISSLSGIKQKRDQMKMENEIYKDQNDIRREQVAVQRLQAENYGEYLKALTTGKNNENAVFFEMFGLKKRDIESSIELREQQQNYFAEVASSEEVRRRLMESGIKLNDANTAATQIQKAILVAQEKYSDQYFKAVADMQSSQALMAGIESSIFEKTTQERYDAAKAELQDIVIRAGMDAKIFTGEAFERSVEGEMTKKDWTQVWSKLVGAVIAGGAVVGSTAIRAASRAVVPPMFPGTWSPSYSSTPYGL